MTAPEARPAGIHFLIRSVWERPDDPQRTEILRTVGEYLDREAVEEAVESILRNPEIDIVSVNTETGVIEGYRQGYVDVLGRRSVPRVFASG